MPVALVTGASRGLGLALARALGERGWRLVVDARDAGALEAAYAGLALDVTALPGDVADRWHREALLAAAGARLDLLVNNASALGPSPLPPLARYPVEALAHVYEVNVLAPLALLQEALPRLVAGAAVLNVSSDAAVEAYPGWGGYGSSKAALDRLSAVLAAEHPELRVYAVDPGDMRTAMHQEAFPGEDISDRPLPEESVPGLLALIEGTLPSGRYQARELAPAEVPVSVLPAARLEAHEPPEERGFGRDDVALMVTTRHDGRLVHARFHELGAFLAPGDLLVVNSSATLAASLEGRLDGAALQLRLSTPQEPDGWVVELRRADGEPFPHPPLGASVELPAGGRARLLARSLGSPRFVLARLELPEPLERYLAVHGSPVRYGYVARRWPLEAYQTVFAREPGSAEMPSAGRPFTHALVTALVSAGVLVAPITLHTGLSSPELGEPPLPERFEVPAATAAVANAVRTAGGRVVAVGTTVCRALETVAAPDGTLAPARGTTGHLVTPEHGLRAVDGLLTGWHEPRSSHLLLLEAAAGKELLARSYAAAEARGYLWHEFGDLQLILP